MHISEFELRIIDQAISYLFIVPFIALPFLIVNFYRYIKYRIDLKAKHLDIAQWEALPIKSILAFVVPIIMIALLSSIMTSAVKSNVLKFLSQATPNATVKVDGNYAVNPLNVISVLQKIGTYIGHHSHPTKPIFIVIKNGGKTLKLELKRDSVRPNEYWVFYPRYRHTSVNEIGRITTNLFDSYK